MLLGNYNVFNSNPGRAKGGPTDPTIFYKGSNNMNFYTGDAVITSVTDKASFSNGYYPPYTWILAPKAGGLSMVYRKIVGTGDITDANLAGGLNGDATLTGAGDITSATGNLIVSAVAALSGSGDITADISGTLQGVVNLVGAGDLTAALGALASLVADLTGAGDVTSGISAIGSMSANIVVSGDVVTAQECAAAVWEALAADFNNPGTMGEKMNSAASAGDPWSTSLPGSYAAGTAGNIVGSKLLTTGKFIALK